IQSTPSFNQLRVIHKRRTKPSTPFLELVSAFRCPGSMSLTLKRTCPFTLTIHSYNENHTLPAMDPDPFASRYLDKTTYNEWQSLSPTTIPEEVFPDPSSQRSPSPPKRPRNAKNLSLSVPAIPKN